MECNVLEGCSPATNFKVRLLEIQQKNSHELSEDQALAIFDVFDEVLPQLGVFQQVLKLVRDELFEVVYSDQYTSSREAYSAYNVATNILVDRGVQETKFIQRIPYFTLVQKVFKQRHEEADQLREDSAVLKKRLHDKSNQYEEAIVILDEQKATIQQMEDALIEHREQIEERDAEIERLKQDIENLEKEANTEQKKLKSEIKALHKKSVELAKQVDFLSKYKKGYDTLEEAFLFRSDEDKFSAGSRHRKPIVASRKSHLLTNFEAAKKLEKQLLMVQNQTIEGFDAFLETHRKELQEKVLSEQQSEKQAGHDAEEIMLEQLDTELRTTQESFQQTIEALTNELEMIRNHKDAIEQQLDDFDKPSSNKPSSQQSTRGVSFSSSKQSKLTSGKETKTSVAGESFDNTDLISSEMDPFVPHEAILSKYSVMIYTSTNSKKTFHELKDAKFCSSCGEKTVLCPHKVTGEKVITLPHQCTHIKLSRPRIRIPPGEKKDLLKPQPPGKSKKYEVSDVSKLSKDTVSTSTGIRSRHAVLDKQQLMAFDRNDSVTPSLGEISSLSTTGKGVSDQEAGEDSQGENQLTTNPFQLLWDDYKQRTTMDRAIPRPLEMKQALSLVYQFYAHVLWQDENIPENKSPHSILDELYIFLEDRYLLKEVMFLRVHDFITTLINYAAVNQEIQIFTHTLVGNLDACTFRYFLLIGDLIDRVDWQHVEDFKAFASNVFAFLNEDDIDQLHLGYTSFSENKISKTLVYEYFMYIILKFREPRFQDVESKLIQHPVKELGFMTVHEFIESMEVLAPLSNEMLRAMFFAQAEAQRSKEGRVSVVPLSQIGSFLMLLQVAPLLRQKIGESVEAATLHPASNISTNTTVTADSVVLKNDESENIMTTSKLRNLAKNIARRNQNRQMRSRYEGNLRYDSESSDNIADMYHRQTSFDKINFDDLLS